MPDARFSSRDSTSSPTPWQWIRDSSRWWSRCSDTLYAHGRHRCSSWLPALAWHNSGCYSQLTVKQHMYRICHYLCVYLYHYHASIYLLFTTYLLFSGALTFKYKYSKHCKVTASSTNILCWSNCLSPTCAISDVTPANVPEKVVEVGQSDWYLPPKWIPRIGLSLCPPWVCATFCVYVCVHLSVSLCFQK